MADAGPDAPAGQDSGGVPRDAVVDGVGEGGIEAPPADPLCATVDTKGLFGSCAACPSDCDTVDVSGRRRYACGCTGTSTCPCGLHCGSLQIAPGVGISGVCVR
jgi:hypothetical protein